MVMEMHRPPRDNIVRAVTPRGDYEVREDGENDVPRLVGHFAVFDEWTEIDSMWEGNFMERIAPGAFSQSFKPANRDRVKVTFNHGHDPTMGDQVIGKPDLLEEDSVGAAYEVPLFDGIPPLLMSGLREGAYGSSFRFRVMREDFEAEPKVSDANPKGLPERTIKEVELFEFGPVTFPAYAGATAGVRSLTDEFLFGRLTEDPARLREIIDYTRDNNIPAPSEPAQADATPEPERSEPEPEPKEEPVEEQVTYRTKDEKATRIGVLKSELATIAEEHSGVLPEDVQERWNTTDKELTELTAALQAQETRERRVSELGTKPGNGEPEPKPEPFQTRTNITDPFDKAAVWRDAKSPQDAAQRFRDNARRVLETTSFPHERANKEDAQTHVEKLLYTADTPDAEIARRILVTGSPAYRRGFAKVIKALDANPPSLTSEERAVMAEGATTTGGFAIVYDLDPTLVPTSNGAVNPYRRVCRVVNISGTNEWRQPTVGAVVATYEAEATEAVDRSPTLAQGAFVTNRAHTFIVLSRELDEDVPSLMGDLAILIQDSKDTLEATQFATGVGTTVFPQGMVVGSTNEFTTGTTLVLAVGDLYGTETTLPPRFRPRAQWFANRFFYNKVRQLDTAGGANLWVQDLRTGLPNNETGNTGFNLLGYPANEASGMVANLTANSKIAVLGDPTYYVIVERIGLDIELVPHMFGLTANYPTGQRGVYAYWRNTARVLSASAFVTVDAL
jgi:HK97 family phage major capsid protein